MFGGFPVFLRRFLTGWGQAVLALVCLGVSHFRSQGTWFESGGVVRFHDLVCLVVTWLLSRTLAMARFHWLLHQGRISVHFLATAQVWLAGLARPWVLGSRRAGSEVVEDLHSRWFGLGDALLPGLRRVDSWLAADWFGWLAHRSTADRNGGLTPPLRISGALWGISVLEHVLECTTWYLVLKLSGLGGSESLALLWVLPLARLAGGMTFQLDGLGARELVLSFLLFPAGGGHAILFRAAAGLLALRFFEIAVGGYILRRRRHSLSTGVPQSPLRTISVVIPVLNEFATLSETVRRVRLVPEVIEIIVVDGGSGDGTASMASALGCVVLTCSPGRGGQLRRGAERATGDVVWLLHADTWVQPDAGELILRCLKDREVVAGGLWKRFRETKWLLMGSRVKCAIRVWIGRRIVGDMAMFVRRDVLSEIGGVPDMELMEDFELSRRLRRKGRLALADGLVVTSARRFLRHGVLATYFKMWLITTLYRLGCSPAELRRRYG